MLLIPLGLVSRTKNLPIATIAIAAFTLFYSIINFNINEQARSLFLHSDKSLTYAREAKNYVTQKCHLNQAKTFCSGLDTSALNIFQWGAKLSGNKNSQDLSAHLVEFVHKNLEPREMEKENPSLYALYLKSEEEKNSFVVENQLLSPSNITWESSLKSPFLHNGILPLLGNILILLFLAFPTEERMGSMLFIGTYLATGIIGSVIHVVLIPDTFYLIGASSSLGGMAGTLTYFFFRKRAKVLISFFFIFNKTIIIPVFIYGPFFVITAYLIGTLDPLTNAAYPAPLSGFLVGLVVALIFNRLTPMPNYFTYPFEYRFYGRSKKNLSQYERIKVFAEWLYYSPANLHAFSSLVSEAERSDSNPKVEKVINHFRKTTFHEVYHLNRKNVDFLKLLPVEWLSWVPVGDNCNYLKKIANSFVEKRDFQSAFKVNFLLLNEVGWKNDHWGAEIVKNCKKASIDKNFKSSIEKLKLRHSPFQRMMSKKVDFDVYSA